MDLENPADVGMADFARVAHLGRQAPVETGFGAFDGDTAVQLLVYGFVDDAHAALRDFADDAETVLEELTGLEMPLGQKRAERVEQEPVHALFPLDVVPDLVEQLRVAGAGAAEVGLLLLEGPGQAELDQAHDELVILRFFWLRFFWHCRPPS